MAQDEDRDDQGQFTPGSKAASDAGSQSSGQFKKDDPDTEKLARKGGKKSGGGSSDTM
ncbi:hypothetical protein KY385_00545 [Candidatus Parcubacteria bacterium]|nr:hypothetical protein [Candidatus Parcubacteria bacterium]